MNPAPPIEPTPAPEALPRPKSKVLLIPWDTASSAHVDRLVQQRVACGWDWEAVPRWMEMQGSGKLNLQWIVLEDSDPEKESRLNKHTSQFPSESEPLLDSAVSFGGKPRSIPLPPQRKFIPVGHICLGQVSDEYAALNYHANDEGAFWISNFYVSRAIQGCGLGTAAMDTAENMAVSEPLNARSLALNAINMVDLEREEKYKALGLSIPLFSNQEWYARRGYRVYRNVEKLFSKVDSTGKTWYWDAVFMRKEIR